MNTVAMRLAQKLGGEAINFYAPAFAETEEECATFFGLTHVVRVLEQARTARMGLFGVGSLQIDSSVIQYCSLPYHVLAELVRQRNGLGEILGYAIDSQGGDCIPELSRLVIGISLDYFRNIPIRIGAAIGAEKAPAIAAAIRGKYFTTLFIDENAARGVLKILEEEQIPQALETQTYWKKR
jgi:DNA-binding transcriptional regulator LsrR (DeoR family)